jgi:hypothetical protein
MEIYLRYPCSTQLHFRGIMTNLVFKAYYDAETDSIYEGLCSGGEYLLRNKDYMAFNITKKRFDSLVSLGNLYESYDVKDKDFFLAKVHYLVDGSESLEGIKYGTTSSLQEGVRFYIRDGLDFFSTSLIQAVVEGELHYDIYTLNSHYRLYETGSFE